MGGGLSGVWLQFSFLLLTGAVVALILLYTRQSELKARFEGLRRQMHELALQLEGLRQELRELRARAGGRAPEAPVVPGPTPTPSPVLPPAVPTPPPPIVTPAAPTPRPVPTLPPPVHAEPPRPPVAPPPAPTQSLAQLLAAKQRAQAAGMGVFSATAPPTAPTTAEPAPPPRRSDLELTIGTSWASAVGMVLVLLAVTFFLKWAFQQGLISPPIRVAMGVVAGIALLAGGEWAQRRGYAVQSQVLTGGGAAVLYLALFAGLRLYRLLDATVTFVAMAAVTAATASQALRHRSKTIAVFAWIAGYLVPALIGERPGATPGASSAPFLFAYLLLLSLAVFVVACRHAWVTFTGLALVAAYSAGAFLFRSSGGSYAWTLTYLLLLTGGMLWLATARRQPHDESFGTVGAAAGYVAIGITLAAGGRGSPEIPYLYLLALTASLLWLSRSEGRRSFHWCGVLGSLMGFVFLLKGGGPAWGEQMLAYAALTTAGSLALSTAPRGDAEPLAVTTIGSAYAAGALLVWAGPVGGVAPALMLGYVAALAVVVLWMTVRLGWALFPAVGIAAAFLATGLLRGGPAGGSVNVYGLAYLVALGAAALAVAARRDNRTLGGLSIAGIFVGLPLARALGPATPDLVVLVYLAVAAIVTTVGIIEWRRWNGLEWLALVGTWGLYLVWRQSSGHDEPAPAYAGFAAVYLVTFLALTWLRHALREEPAQEVDALFAAGNVVAFFATGYWDLSRASTVVSAPGMLALGLAALYLGLGLVAVTRRPGDWCFGPVLLGLGIAAFTAAVPLLLCAWTIGAMWALEAALLVALGLYYGSPALRMAGAVALLLSLAAAVGLHSRPGPMTYRLLLNDAGLSLLAVIAALYAAPYAYTRAPDQAHSAERDVSAAAPIAASVLLWWLLSSEAWRFTGWQLHAGREAQQYALSAVWTLYGAALMAVGLGFQHAISRWTAIALFAIAVGKVLVLDLAGLPLPYRILASLGLGAALIAVSFAYQRLVRVRATGAEEE